MYFDEVLSFNIFDRVHQKMALFGFFGCFWAVFLFDTTSTRAKLIMLHGGAYYLPRVALGKLDHKAQKDFCLVLFSKKNIEKKNWNPNSQRSRLLSNWQSLKSFLQFGLSSQALPNYKAELWSANKIKSTAVNSQAYDNSVK